MPAMGLLDVTFEFEYNGELDVDALTDLFARVGWDESEQTSKVEWAIVSSDDWIVCLLEGEMVGFGRTFGLDPRRKVIFDVIVDERFRGIGLAEEITRRLAEAVPSVEFQVFGRHSDGRSGPGSWAEASYEAPEASPETYTGR